MLFLNVRQIASMFLIGLGWFLLPAQAQAQVYVCGSGPGPGERMVGMSPGGNGVASVPMCVQDGPGPSPRSAPPPRARDWYAAIAWHADASDAWIQASTVGYDDAKRGALARCNEIMGSGCTTGPAWANSRMTVFRDKMGSLRSGWEGDDGTESKTALAECSAGQLLPCEVLESFRSSDYRSPDTSARKLYAVSAWVDGIDGYDHKLYVASGLSDLETAEAAAIKACHDATSQVCKVNAWTGNGFIQAYRLSGGDDSATVETSAKRARDAAWENCRKQDSTICELQASFDSRKPGLFVHDFIAARAAR